MQDREAEDTVSLRTAWVKQRQSKTKKEIKYELKYGQ